jgi:trigger factor
VQQALPILYAVCVQENNIQPIEAANTVIRALDPIQVQFEVDVYPEIEVSLPELEIEKVESTLEEKEVDDALANIKKSYGEFTASEEPAKNGDKLVIAFKGEVDGETSPELQSEEFPIELGSQTFIPGFEEKLVGLNKDEEIDFDITFPEDYHAENYRAKEAKFNVKIKEITCNVEADLNDDFIKKITKDEISNLEDLKTDIRKKILERKDLGQRQNQDMLIADKLADANDVAIPASMLKAEIDFMKSVLEGNLANAQLTMEKYLEDRKLSEDQLLEEIKPEAQKRIKIRIALLAYAKQAKIEVHDSEVNEEDLKKDTKSQDEFDRALAAKKTEILLTKTLNELRAKYTKA